MNDFGTIIYMNKTGAFIINDGMLTVPSPNDTSVPEIIHKEFDELYKEIKSYAEKNPNKVIRKDEIIREV